MIVKLLIVLVFLIAMSDVSITGKVDYAALFARGASMKLEQPEGVKTGVNLMSSGDYSGCTLVRVVSEAPGWTDAGRIPVVLPSQGMAWAIIYVGRSVENPESRR
jgi:hypothetical protein